MFSNDSRDAWTVTFCHVSPGHWEWNAAYTGILGGWTVGPRGFTHGHATSRKAAIASAVREGYLYYFDSYGRRRRLPKGGND